MPTISAPQVATLIYIYIYMYIYIYIYIIYIYIYLYSKTSDNVCSKLFLSVGQSNFRSCGP